MSNYQTFGRALSEALLRDSKSSAWLSRKTGKDKGQISKYLNDNTVPRAVTIKELTEPLSVDIRQNENDSWRLIPKKMDDRSDTVRELSYSYISDDYSTEKEQLDNLFKDLDDIEQIFSRTKNDGDLSHEQQLIQLEMINKKLFDIFLTYFSASKNKPDTTD